MNNNIINNDKKTVFFGPFIGELGWELSYWQGWVKKMCRERYDSYRKITASYPGKEPFYPDVDEFWQLPEDFLKLRVCARAYASDFWKGNIPKGDNADSFDKNISQHADNLLKYFRNKLPSDTIFYTPYKLNRYMLDNKKHFLGSIFMKGFNDIPKIFSPPFEHQIFGELNPTPKGEIFLRKIFDPNKRMIAIFPRYRLGRRIDKNWQKEKYDLLIKNLQKKYPNHVIGIFGSSCGSYYARENIGNCINFVNVDERIRLNVQLAALKRADVAIGGQSGALIMALLAKCPVAGWGFMDAEKQMKGQNFLNTRFIYWPEVDPPVAVIENLATLMIEKKEKEVINLKMPEGGWSFEVKKSFAGRVADKVKKIIREPFVGLIPAYFKKNNFKEGLLNLPS